MSGLLLQNLPQDILQDATVPVVENFLRRIDTHDSFELGVASVGPASMHHEWLARGAIFQKRGKADQIVGFLAGTV